MIRSMYLERGRDPLLFYNTILPTIVGTKEMLLVSLEFKDTWLLSKALNHVSISSVYNEILGMDDVASLITILATNGMTGVSAFDRWYASYEPISLALRYGIPILEVLNDHSFTLLMMRIQEGRERLIQLYYDIHGHIPIQLLI